MKKLFSLLTAIVLCSSMTWAQGSFAHFPYGTAGVSITITTGNQQAPYGRCDWDTNVSGQTLVHVLATNSNTTTRNHLSMWFKNTNTQQYSDGNGGSITGPAVGTYTTFLPNLDCYYSEWYDYNYSGIIRMRGMCCNNFCDWCYYGAIIGNSSNGTSRPDEDDDNTFFLDNTFNYTVAEGNGGTMYLAIRDNETNTLLITIGEPKTVVPKSKGTITANASPSAGGSVNVYPSGLQNGGTNVTLTPYNNEGYVFRQWSDGVKDNPRVVSVDGDETYVAEFVDIVEVDNSSLLLVFDGSDELTNGNGAWFNVSGGDDDDYAFSIESYGVAFNTTTFNTEAFFDKNNTTLEYQGSNIPLEFDKSSVSFVSKVTKNKYKIYDVEANLMSSSHMYHITSTALRAIADDMNNDYNEAFTSCSVSTSPQYGSREGQALYMRATKAGEWTQELELEFFVTNPSVASIPTGTYTISHTQAAGTVMVGHNSSTPSKGVDNMYGSWTQSWQKSGNYYNYGNWFLADGTVDVLNVNEHYYVRVNGINSLTHDMTMTVGADIPLRTVSLTAPGNGNSATINSAIPAAIDGKYYDYTLLSLHAQSTTGWRFKCWKNNGIIISEDADYTYTVGATNLLTAEFERIYAITITQPSHGTLTVKNGTTTIASGDKIAENTKLTVTYSGNGYDAVISPTLDANNQFTVSANTTVSAVVTAHTYNITYTGLEGADNSGNTITTYTIEDEDINLANPGTRAHYTFKEWQEGGVTVTKIAHGSYGDKTLTAIWEKEKFAVIFYDEDGTTSLQNTDVEYDEHPIYAGETPTKDATAQYTYEFAGWNDGTTTYAPNAELPAVTGAATYTATYNSTVNKYTVTWQNYDGTELEKDLEVAYGATPSYDGATPTKAEDDNFSYAFAGWDGDITAEITGDITFTATFTQHAKAFVLKDGYTETDKNNGNDNNFYSTLASMAGQTVESVTYERNFLPGTWNVFSLPFNYSLIGENRTFAGDVYELTSIDYNYIENYLTLFFIQQTISIEANRPYLYYSETGFENEQYPVFGNVKIETLAENPYTVNNNGSGSGSIKFLNTMCRQQLEKNGHNIIFIANNKLYYLANNAVYMRAFRGYFIVNGFDLNVGVAPRVRISLDGQTATELEVVSDLPKSGDGQVKKYIENGVMIIEREGVRYDATGAKIN